MTNPNKNPDLLTIEYTYQKELQKIDFENKCKLLQYKTDCQCFQDSQKFNVEFSKIALQGTFLLNGAGLIPIIYSKVDYFYSAGMWFAAGAGVSVLAACATFAYQNFATETWRDAAFKTNASSHREAYELGLFGWKIPRGWLSFLRAFAVVLVGASLILFAAGLYRAGKNADTLVKKIGERIRNDNTKSRKKNTRPDFQFSFGF